MKTFLALVCMVVACTPLLASCAPSLSPCAMAYKKAGECPECTAAEIEARIAEVDKDCAHLLNPSSSVASSEGGAK